MIEDMTQIKLHGSFALKGLQNHIIVSACIFLKYRIDTQIDKCKHHEHFIFINENAMSYNIAITLYHIVSGSNIITHIK